MQVPCLAGFECRPDHTTCRLARLRANGRPVSPVARQRVGSASGGERGGRSVWRWALTTSLGQASAGTQPRSRSGAVGPAASSSGTAIQEQGRAWRPPRWAMLAQVFWSPAMKRNGPPRAMATSQGNSGRSSVIAAPAARLGGRIRAGREHAAEAGAWPADAPAPPANRARRPGASPWEMDRWTPLRIPLRQAIGSLSPAKLCRPSRPWRWTPLRAAGCCPARAACWTSGRPGDAEAQAVPRRLGLGLAGPGARCRGRRPGNGDRRRSADSGRLTHLPASPPPSTAALGQFCRMPAA